MEVPFGFIWLLAISACVPEAFVLSTFLLFLLFEIFFFAFFASFGFLFFVFFFAFFVFFSFFVLHLLGIVCFFNINLLFLLGGFPQ